MKSKPIAPVPVAFVAPDVAADVAAIHGRLGFCPAPGRWRFDASLEPAQMLDADLAALRAGGTTTLVVLLEQDEMALIGLAGLLEKARRAGLETLWFPIRDGTAPSDTNATVQLVERMVDRVASGGSVVVHCHGGVGRSGTIAACCLVASGADPADALAAVRRARALAATAPGQEEFVHAFAAAWAERGARAAALSPHQPW